jgi:NADH-quinone oxidoreductase subunit N
MQTPDLITVIPELILLVGACLVLLVDPFLKPGADGRVDRTAVIAITLVALAGSIVLSLAFVGQSRASFAGMVVLNDWAIFFKVLFAAAGALTVLLSSGYLESQKRHLGEYYALLLFAIIGMDLMAAARDLILLWVALELMSIASYLLAAFFRYRVKSNESSLKYLLTGSFASAIMLYGISVVYGLSGATSYKVVGQAIADPAAFGAGGKAGILLAITLVAIGLAFKVSAVPFHQWIPDVYQGAPTPIAAFFSVGPKAAAFSTFISAFIIAFGQN